MDRLTSVRTLALIATAGLSILAVIGDYYVFRHLKLVTSGGVYAVCLVLALTFMGLIGFRDTLRTNEMPGIAMAICSLVLLTRFARVIRP